MCICIISQFIDLCICLLSFYRIKLKVKINGNLTIKILWWIAILYRKLIRSRIKNYISCRVK